MIKKTVIKRAYKSWPLTKQREQIEKVIDITAEDSAIDFNEEIDVTNDNHETKEDRFKIIRGKLEFLEKTEEASLDFLSRTCGRKIEAIEELTNNEADLFEAMLDDFINKKTEDQGNGENQAS